MSSGFTTDVPEADSSLRHTLAAMMDHFTECPAKRRSDYARFELLEPPLVLSLIPVHPAGGGGSLNHFGLRVTGAETLVEIRRRLELARGWGGVLLRPPDQVLGR